LDKHKNKVILRLLTQHQIQTKLTHPAVWTITPPSTIAFFFIPNSVPENLHIQFLPCTFTLSSMDFSS